MNMNKNSTIQNTARLGVCFLIGAAAFAACGQVKEDQASSSPVVAPAASTIQSSVAFDRQSSLECWHRTTPSRLCRAGFFTCAPETFGYVSPEALDKQAQLEVAAAHALSDSEG